VQVTANVHLLERFAAWHPVFKFCEADDMINIVHLQFVYSFYTTGVDRYIEMFCDSVADDEDIRSHTVFLTDNSANRLFPEITRTDSGELNVLLYVPKNARLLDRDRFWKRRFFAVVADLLTPFFTDMDAPIFESHNLYTAMLAEELKMRFGGSIVMHLHCIPWKFCVNQNRDIFHQLYKLYAAGKYDEFRELEGSKVDYGSSDVIICLSEAAKDYLCNIHHIAPSKIRIVRNGLKSDVAETILRTQNTLPVILYAGKLSRDKGVFELLEALKRVKLKGYEFRLILAGMVPESDAARLEHYKNCIDMDILGQIPYGHLKKLYETCTMGIIPSLHEQCSYVALEMASFGVPMIVSQVDALSEMFEHGKTALLTPLIFDDEFGLSTDMEAFVRNIIRLLNTPALRMKLSSNVRRMYERKYTINSLKNNMLPIYKINCVSKSLI
jgi:glycosyltransferase involved in cell wall biosynthesis